MLWGTFCSALWKAVGSEIYPARGDIHAMTRAGLEGGDRSRALHGIFSFPLPRTSPHPRWLRDMDAQAAPSQLYRPDCAGMKRNHLGCGGK